MLLGTVIKSPSQLPHFNDGVTLGGRPLGLLTSGSSGLAVEEELSTPPPARDHIASSVKQ